MPDQQSMRVRLAWPGAAAESGREVCYTLHFMAGKIATFLRIHVKAQCGNAPERNCQNLQMVEKTAKKLRQVAVKEARVAVKWDRAAIEMARVWVRRRRRPGPAGDGRARVLRQDGHAPVAAVACGQFAQYKRPAPRDTDSPCWWRTLCGAAAGDGY